MLAQLIQDPEERYPPMTGKMREPETGPNWKETILFPSLLWLEACAVTIMVYTSMSPPHSEFSREIKGNAPQILGLLAGLAALIGIVSGKGEKTLIELAAVSIAEKIAKLGWGQRRQGISAK